MMALQLLTLGDKVKLQIIQPYIKCIGRSNVDCYYRGKVVEDWGDEFVVQIKSYGKDTRVLFSRKTGNCLTEGFKDLQIKE